MAALCVLDVLIHRDAGRSDRLVHETCVFCLGARQNLAHGIPRALGGGCVVASWIDHEACGTLHRSQLRRGGLENRRPRGQIPGRHIRCTSENVAQILVVE